MEARAGLMIVGREHDERRGGAAFREMLVASWVDRLAIECRPSCAVRKVQLRPPTTDLSCSERDCRR